MSTSVYALTSTEEIDDDNDHHDNNAGGYFSTKVDNILNKRKESVGLELLKKLIDENELDNDDNESDEENEFEAFELSYRRKIWLSFVIRVCCVVSVVSVCMNTPQTFKKYPQLRTFTLVTDIITGLILACEAVVKIKYRGLIKGKNSYLRNGGRIFELIMVLCILSSIMVQSYEMNYSVTYIENNIGNTYLKLSFIRALRPLLLFRVIQSLLNLNLPQTVSYRSLKQIRGVLMFTLYFFILAAMLGIQMFGTTHFYCIKNTTDLANVRQTDMLVPVTRCPPSGYTGSAFRCPDGFMCRSMRRHRHAAKHGTEPFEGIISGFMTIYETSTMEGWSSIMYDIRDVRSPVMGAFYAIALVIFISLLVKNVFVAIITETFSDLRLQVSKLSQANYHGTQTKDDNLVLRRSHDHWTLIDQSSEIVSHVFIRWNIVTIIKHWMFITFIVFCIIADAILQLFAKEFLISKYFQIVFTLIFLSETLLKMFGFGMKNFFQYTPNVYEFFINIGSLIFLPPVLMGRYEYVIFQVVRPFRLVFISSTLRSFLRRILGSGKKLGHLILFTISFLFIGAGICVQLFCGMALPASGDDDDEYSFANFPRALKALYQIFMTEGWVEIMTNTLEKSGSGYDILVYISIILFHLIGATVLVSVFVALILDNLELEEDVKIAKQRRLGAEVADTQERLPARMLLYQYLKPRPEMTKIDIPAIEVLPKLPKLRQTFVNQYINGEREFEKVISLTYSLMCCWKKVLKTTFTKGIPIANTDNKPEPPGYFEQHRKQSSFYDVQQNIYKGQEASQPDDEKEPLTRNSIQAGFRRHFSVQLSKKLSRTPQPENALYNKHQIIPIPNRPKNISKFTNLQRRHQNLGYNSNKKTNIDFATVRKKMENAQRNKESQIENIRENHPLLDHSLFIFSVENPIRKFAQLLVHSRYNLQTEAKTSGHTSGFSVERLKNYFATQTWLEWCMLVCTQISILAILNETPTYRTFDHPLLSIAEHFFFVTSTIELVMKIIADGLLLTPNAFIRNFSNVLHICIYVVSLTYIVWKPTLIKPWSAAQVVLILRGLRPLRLIALTPGLRKVIINLLSGYKSFIKLVLLKIALMFVFASYGVQFLGGRLKRCNDPSVSNEANCTGVFKIKVAKPGDFKFDSNCDETAILVPRVWRNPRSFNFDNFGQAMSALLEIQSLEGWTEVRDILEKINYNASIYIHLYAFFASLIGLTLFIGVIVSNFNENKGTALLTVEQKRWKDLKKKLSLTQPLRLPQRPPTESLRHKLFIFLIGNHYNRIYSILILINCAMICTGQWVPREINNINTLIYISIFCCLMYVIDTFVKIYTFGWGGYWWSWRNRLDFALMVGGVFFMMWYTASCRGVYMNKTSCELSMQYGVTVFILRFISLSGKHNLLRMLINTVVISLLKSFYTLVVIVCIILCYSFIGVIVFGSVKPGLAINRKVNFSSSTNAFLLLFRMATGEDWNKILHDAKVPVPYCTMRPNENYWLSNCGDPTFAMFYFHTYYFTVTYIFLNLFIAVVIENFSIFYSTDDDPIMSQQDIKCFQQTWNVCDVEQAGSMSLVRAKVVLRLLQGGLSLDNMRAGKPLTFRRIIAELKKVKTTKNVTFHNLLFVLAHNKIDHSSLQLAERWEREEFELAILKEVAMDTIQEWFIRFSEKKKKETEMKIDIEEPLHDQWESSSSSSEEENTTTTMRRRPGFVSSPAQSYEFLNYDTPVQDKYFERDEEEEYNESTEKLYMWWNEELENED